MYGEINNVPPWYSPTAGSPDYYNACAGSSVNAPGVPLNGISYQSARTGNAYAGIFFYGISTTDTIEGKEYLQIQLTDSLIANRLYCVSYYVSFAVATPESWHQYNFVSMTELGMYISDDTISLNSQRTLPYTPQIQSPFGIYFNDTSNWVEVSGYYTAHGGEKYITIGNFNTHTDTASFKYNSYFATVAYYFVDDVSVFDCDSINGINENNSKDINVYPNPLLDKLNVQTSNYEQTEIILYDLSSRKLLQQTFINTTTINTEQLAKGMYLYTVRNKSGIIKNGKVIKE